jgi:plasmid stabilization system protein ParE
MRALYTESAYRDIGDILSRVAADKPNSAADVARAIRAAIARLQSFPELGAKTNKPGIYMQIARPFDYLIFYRIVGDTLVIRHVRHPSINK